MRELIKKISPQYEAIRTNNDEMVFDAMWEVSENTLENDPIYTNAVLNVTNPNHPDITIHATETFKETTALYLEDITDTKSRSYINRVENSQKAFQQFHSKDLTTD